MKTGLKYGALGLCFYLVFVVLLLPASQVYAWVKDFSPVKLYGVKGTLWQGSADAISYQRYQFNDLSWDSNFLALFAGRLDYYFELKKNDGRLSLNAGRSATGTFHFSNIKASFPAPQVEPFVSQMQIGLTGHIEGNLSEIKIENNLLSFAEGLVTWRQAGLQVPIVALGDFEAPIETTDKGIVVKINDKDGPVEVNAQIVIAQDGQYNLSALLALRDPSRNDLKQALRFIGNPGPSGKINLTRSGLLTFEPM